jgi:hypothetical protein
MNHLLETSPVVDQRHTGRSSQIRNLRYKPYAAKQWIAERFTDTEIAQDPQLTTRILYG